MTSQSQSAAWGAPYPSDCQRPRLRTGRKTVQSRRTLIVMLLVTSLVSTVASQTIPPATGVLQREGAVTRDPELDGPRMSLVFEQPVAIRDVLILLVRGTTLSLVPYPGPALDQKLVADLKNVTIRQALDAILEPLGLDYTSRGKVLRVFPRELDTQFFDVDYVTARHIEGATDLYADLEEGVRALLSSDGRMHLDRVASLLQVTDRPSRLQRIEGYLQLALRRATRQIQLEATAVEVDLNDTSRAAVDWSAVLDRLAIPGTTASRGALSALSLPGGSVRPVLQALAEQGAVRVVANPRILAMNNQPALVRTEGRPGFMLTVTPQISSTGVIIMSVHSRVTARIESDESRGGGAQPILSLREADTLVRVRQGDTVVLSGFTQSTSNGDRATERKTDLVILLTPTVIAPGVRVVTSKTP